MPTARQAFDSIRPRIESIPVIDCHEHSAGPLAYPRHAEPIASLIFGYVASDVISAGGEADMPMLQDPKVSTDEKWPAFQRIWKRTEHTAYARVTRWILKNEYGIDAITLPALKSMQGRLLNLSDPAAYEAYLKKHGIRCRLVNIWIDWKKFLAGQHQLPAYDRLLIGLPDYHSVRSFDQINAIAGRTGQRVTGLEEYLAVCRAQFERFKQLGAIGFKDQSAYTRSIAYTNPPRSAAEELFNEAMADPRRNLGWPRAQPLDDYLFHQFMRMAREMDLPVQIHTGHMAGIRNDIAKTNAVLFSPVLELHRDVRFDLFHGNWPYCGEWLYLAKNYPNVSLDCCWLHIIDAGASRRVLVDGVTAVPHGKIHGFGGDYGDCIEYAAGHLAIARDNIAWALADLMERDWLSADEAVGIAADWLFNNPNEFFRLGFEAVRPG